MKEGRSLPGRSVEGSNNDTKRFPVEERNGRLFFRGADLGATDRWPGWFGDYGGTGHTA